LLLRVRRGDDGDRGHRERRERKASQFPHGVSVSLPDVGYGLRAV
jgi:hypothetical protein